MKRMLASLVLAGACAVPASAAPSPTKVQTTLQPGQRLVLTLGRVPRGQFAFRLRVSSDGVKRFVLSQQRAGRARFKVLGATSRGCQGAAGSLYCSNVTTPAPATSATYIFRLTNLGKRPLAVVLRVAWSRITSAG